MSRQYDAAGNLVEYIRQPLYDKVDITSSGTSFKFFSTPRGQNSKTFHHTNMDVAGQLPNPKGQIVDGIRFVPTGNQAAANQLADMRQLLYNGTWFKFEIGGLKPYLIVPLWYIPAGVGIAGFSDQGGLTGATHMLQVSNGAPIWGNYLGIRSHPVFLPAQQTFEVTITADAALSNMSGTIGSWVSLEGIHSRETL